MLTDVTKLVPSSMVSEIIEIDTIDLQEIMEWITYLFSHQALENKML
jgi:hypothetical protein